MEKDIAEARGQLVQVLKVFLAALLASPDRERISASAAALVDLVNGFSADTRGRLAPHRIMGALLDFVNTDINLAYAANGPQHIPDNALPAPPSSLARLRHFIEEFGGKAPADVPLLDLSAGPDKAIIRFGGKRLTLSPNEEYVLTALVSRDAMSLSDLRRQSGDEHADRTLKQLRTKYPTLAKYITMPGGNNRGGYSTTILRAK